jgi:predicted acyl esterase
VGFILQRKAKGCSTGNTIFADNKRSKEVQTVTLLKKYNITLMAVLWLILSLSGPVFSADAEFDVVVAHGVMVPMRDGVNLNTDTFFPAKNGKAVDYPLPVVLE